MARVNGYTKFFRPACGSRRCTRCQPTVIGKKLNRIDTDDLYATIVKREDVSKISAQLRGYRTKHGHGEFMKIPVSATAVLVVSDAPIGAETTLEAVEDAMYASRSEWGCISSSKGWRTPKEPRVEREGYQDEGIVTSSLEWIESNAKRMGLSGEEREYSLSYRTSDEDHVRLREIAGVRPDAEVWEDIRANSHWDPYKYFYAD